MKPQLMIAGPGAGKTYNMVEYIQQAMVELQPYRYLVAITYTNVAANSIQRKLGDLGLAKRNIFIGTTHSFVNRFILLPFASLFEGIPSDRVFGEVNIREHPAVEKQKTPASKMITARKITANLILKGVIPYDSMLSLAQKIVKRPECRKQISNRVQYLFVDEFQDVDTRQLEVFEELRKSGNTKIFGIGDPEQYITSFAYGLRGQASPDFSKIPLNRFKEKADVENLSTNRRANQNLVSFLNNFRKDLIQVALKPLRPNERLLFLPSTNLAEIVKSFRNETRQIETADALISRLYLSFKNGFYDTIVQEFGLAPISSDLTQSSSVMREAVALIEFALGSTERKIIRDFKISKIEIRRVALDVLIIAQKIPSGVDDLWQYLLQRFQFEKSASRASAVKEAFCRLGCAMSAVGDGNEQFATIHKAKGLEADAVLVVAETNNELSKWLVRDPAQRAADKQDKCRLGYVAFSRARECLCLACLQPLNSENRSTIGLLGVTCLKY